ncbi:MAG: 1-deoxy-D-xylulose-5-phosphate reductoisomerase [Dehalococcoidia bacterium]|nr:1-deoxy-D-xylulose-5-phosphate reductoisomerase [Dehalococcoidia bacterium]
MNRSPNNSKRPKNVVLLGSTGSVGTQTLDVIRALPDRFQVLGLAAGRNVELLASQIAEFTPDRYYAADGHEPANSGDCRPVSLIELATLDDVDLVVAAMSGADALEPVIAALEAGIPVALANKELVVMAGEYLREAAQHGGTEILPVDSEPSAIWQCIRGETEKPRRLIITASGGAFRDRSWDALRSVSPEEALEHPTWQMGRKITIDSATLINKALEVVEAHWLFDIPYEQIDVVMHKQSVIHSMVEFQDGSVKAQMGPPDLRYPIQCALTYPERVENPTLPRFDPIEIGSLTFEELNSSLYPCFDLALDVAKRGGTWRAALIGADEAAVDLFLDGKIGFTEIGPVIEQGLSAHQPIMDPSLRQLAEAASETASRIRTPISGVKG